MKAYQLTMPDGSNAVWVCGNCHRIGSQSDAIYRKVTHGIEDDSGKNDADRCCQCRECGASLPAKRIRQLCKECGACGNVITIEPCVFCSHRASLRYMWFNFAVLLTLIGAAYVAFNADTEPVRSFAACVVGICGGYGWHDTLSRFFPRKPAAPEAE